ncbi:TetR/AcrR family transcriptional regulator [Streptomyces cinerochromogenes]|uniref:TetR/AcrR family transcriptional regulator n=1 Tax=Streptomyces cinerochromogenes TaxID=66422 RepID=UPI0033AA5274
MPRMSRAVTEQHRRQVIESTSRLIREKGADRVTVPEAMATAGLTHGGFYRHFASKDDLLAQALAAAFTERRAAMDRITEEHGSADASARTAFLAMYLSELHRDHPADGCPAAAVAADAAHAEPGTPLRTTFTAGLRQLADGLRQMDEPARDGDADAALADLALLVGTVLLSRASDDEDLSRAFLAAARDRLAGRAAPSPEPATAPAPLT